MFRAFTCDSITVPSCEQHNNSKGGNDQAIVSAFLIPLSNGADKYPLEDDVLKAVQIAQSSFERVKRRAIDSSLFRNPPEILQDLPDLAYLIPDMDIREWIRQLTAALVYDCIQYFDPEINQSKIISWSPDWLSAGGPASLKLEQVQTTLLKNREIQTRLEELIWYDGWSAYPQPYPSIIYKFQVHFEPDNEVIFRHTFYNRYRWYAWFSVSNPTVAKLKHKLSV